ncbi:unnamed protein product, partial [Allacma fusca]
MSPRLHGVIKSLLIFTIFETAEISCQNTLPVRCPFSNVITDANGRPVPSQTASLQVGRGGPILLSDS